MSTIYNLTNASLRQELQAAILELDTLAGIIERQREWIAFQDTKINALEVQYKEEKRKSYELICAALETEKANG